MNDDKKLEVEPYYLRQGKDIVDVLFEKRFLDNDLVREALFDMDNYIGFIIQSCVETGVRADRLIRKVRK